MKSEALARAVELAAAVREVEQMPEVVAELISEQLAFPVSSLAALAALVGAVAEIAEQQVELMLADPELLTLAACAALDGRPLTGAQVGVSRGLLLREAGLGVARLG